MLDILYTFGTLPLLNLRSVNHHIQNLVIRIVHERLLLAASLPDRKLILECYHPSAQFTEPYVFCEYLGTPGLSRDIAGHGSIYNHADGNACPGALRNLYSTFRPSRKTPEPRLVRSSHPAGDVPGSRTSDANSSKSRDPTEPVTRIISLDSHENFSQLCVDTSLVQIGARRGIFLGLRNIVEKKSIRLFRQWLKEMALGAETASSASCGGSSDGLTSFEKGSSGASEVLWVDERTKVAGLKLKVQEKKWRRDVPILRGKDEDPPVSYSLGLDGEQPFRFSNSCIRKVLHIRYYLRSQNGNTILTFSRTAPQHNSPPVGRRTAFAG